MKNLRYRTALFLNYIQVISFLTIPIYIILALLTINYISNLIIVLISLALTTFFTINYLDVKTILE